MPLNNLKFKLGRPVKRTIKWGKYRDFPYQNKTLNYLIDKKSKYASALENLIENGIKNTPTKEQRDHLVTLFSTPGYHNFHWFLATYLLSIPFFRLQPKPVKRIWFLLELLGEENQRPGGYTLPDIEKFANIEKRNRTLARYYVERLIELGILEKVNQKKSYPRYQLSGLSDDNGSNESYAYWELSDILYDLNSTIQNIKDLIGPEKSWKNWLDESGQKSGPGIAETRLGKIIFMKDTNEKVAELVNLLDGWVSILLSIIASDAKRDEDIFSLISKSGFLEDVDRFRKKYRKEGEKFSIEKESEDAYLLVDLKNIHENFSLRRDLDNSFNSLLEEFERYPIPVRYYFKRK